MREIILVLFLFIGLQYATASPDDSLITGKSKNGVRTGAWTYFDQQHHILKVEKYRRGKLIQTYIFNSDGKVIERINRKGYHTKLRACGC